MKILFATDFHLRTTTPVSRLDKNFEETVLKKLDFVISVGQTSDIIILGGDIFDRPDISFHLATEVINILKKSKRTIYSLVGQHDIYGYQQSSINFSPIGLIFSLSYLKPINELILNNLYIKAINVYDNLDFKIEKDKKREINICFAHKLITTKKFPGAVNIEAIHSLNDFDIIINGDIHEPHDIKIDGKRYIAPGSVARLTSSDKNRIPKALLINTDTSEIQYINIPCENDIFNNTVIDCNKEDMSNFIKQYAQETISIKTEPYKIKNILEKYLKENKIDKNIEDMIMLYINGGTKC